MENFIKEIKINSSRNIKDLIIPLSKEKRQHLILTGKNGSGKTSLLLELNKYLTQIDNGTFQHYENQLQYLEQQKNALKSSTDKKRISQFEKNIKNTEKWFDSFGGTEIVFSNDKMEIHNQCQSGEFLLSFFDSKRLSNLNIPQGIKKIDL